MIDRRNFLRGRLPGNPAQAATPPIRWVRPPFALEEAEFLTACTRCSGCIEACPHNIVFPLAATLGETVVNTPALDLLHKGCHLCLDWPCVAACDPGALRRPQNADGAPEGPALAWVQIDANACLAYLGPECAACQGSCPVPGALTFTGERPAIDADLCVGCGLCREACIVDPKAIVIRPFVQP
jgi:ferredoxin-type protein NapG